MTLYKEWRLKLLGIEINEWAVRKKHKLNDFNFASFRYPHVHMATKIVAYYGSFLAHNKISWENHISRSRESNYPRGLICTLSYFLLFNRTGRGSMLALVESKILGNYSPFKLRSFFGREWSVKFNLKRPSNGLGAYSWSVPALSFLSRLESKNFFNNEAHINGIKRGSLVCPKRNCSWVSVFSSLPNAVWSSETFWVEILNWISLIQWTILYFKVSLRCYSLQEQ